MPRNPHYRYFCHGSHAVSVLKADTKATRGALQRPRVDPETGERVLAPEAVATPARELHEMYASGRRGRR